MNELLLIAVLLFTYASILIAYRYFGKSGLYCMSVLATVLANIEVVMLIEAFGIEQTLGNILFASTFLIADILSECEGKVYAKKSIGLGIAASIFFLILTQTWRWYQPAAGDTMQPAIHQLFTFTPRIILASLGVYVISQFVNVWLFHKWWDFTERKLGSRKKYLWLRNNGSTIISQLVNTLLFTLLAFAGTYDANTVLHIFLSSYLIYITMGLLDTPIIYLARKISERREQIGATV